MAEERVPPMGTTIRVPKAERLSLEPLATSKPVMSPQEEAWIAGYSRAHREGRLTNHSEADQGDAGAPPKPALSASAKTQQELLAESCRCQTCLCWVCLEPVAIGSHRLARGECHGAPPGVKEYTYSIGKTVETAFPMTKANDWCWQHQRIPDPPRQVKSDGC